MNEKKQTHKENENPGPGVNSDLIPSFLDSGFSEGDFSARLYCIRKRRRCVGKKEKLKVERGDGRVCCAPATARFRSRFTR